MKALKITYRDIKALVPYARNARTHSDQQVAEIAASIREFGWTNPVLLDEAGGIIAGHGRVMAARKLGMEQVPTITLGHLTDVQRRAYVLADNKLALNSGWDSDMLRLEIEGLQELSFETSLLGFSEAEINLIMSDWSANEGLLNSTESDSSGITARLKITCAEQDADDVLQAVEKALKAFAGATVVRQ